GLGVLLDGHGFNSWGCEVIIQPPLSGRRSGAASVADSQSSPRQDRPLPAPESCPRFHRCSAAVCPLSPDEGYHRWGGRVCPYLREAVKEGADAYFAGRPAEATYRACKLALPVVTAQYADLACQLQRSAAKGLKL